MVEGVIGVWFEIWTNVWIDQIDNESIIDSPISDLQFEDADEDLDELATLDAIDQKLDELTQVSDESLGELNELLDSVQQNELEEEQLNKIYQDT